MLFVYSYREILGLFATCLVTRAPLTSYTGDFILTDELRLGQSDCSRPSEDTLGDHFNNVLSEVMMLCKELY